MIATKIRELVSALGDEFARLHSLSFSVDDLRNYREGLGLSHGDLYDALAMELATGFRDQRYSFDFCDVLINRLWDLLDHVNQSVPDAFYEVYEAFDAGEHSHRDTVDDPIAEKTRPIIEQFLRKRH